MAVAEGAAAGLREPEHRVVGSSDEVVLEMGEAAREGEPGDAGRDVHREVERDEAGSAARQVGTVDGGASGRGACWLMVLLKAAGVRLSGAAAGRERSELALDWGTPAAYSVLMSQHAPPSRRPGQRRRARPRSWSRSPAAGRSIPDDGRRAAGGGSRVTGRRVGVVALPIPIRSRCQPPAARPPSPSLTSRPCTVPTAPLRAF